MEEDINPEMVRKNWKTLTDAQLAIAAANPKTCVEILKVVSKMEDNQIKIVFPLLSGEQIKRLIPQMQLEKQGAAVSVMNSSQVRDCVAAIPKGDRQLLLQNITLITQSEKPDSQCLNELQSFITFIDPLAMAIAVENPELVEKVIQVTSIMTVGQIRVIVPLMKLDQIRRTMENIESEDCFDVAVEMLTTEQNEEFSKIFEKEHNELESKRKLWQEETDKISDTHIIALQKDIESFCAETKTYSLEAEKKYRDLSDQVFQVRSQIETLQKLVRSIQKEIKLPIRLITKQSNEGLFNAYQSLSENYIALSRQLHSLLLRLTMSNLQDGLINVMNNKWQPLLGLKTTNSPVKTHPDSKTLSEAQPSIGTNANTNEVSNSETLASNTTTVTRSQSNANEDAKADAFNIASCNDVEIVFVDEDQSVILYEAVKAIGNPGTFGDIYKISWDDIIKCGFRKESDFTEKNIRNLKDLETYLSSQLPKTQPSGPPK